MDFLASKARRLATMVGEEVGSLAVYVRDG